MSSSKPAHLDPSELGTKEYWDKLYATELTNHAANPSDTGTNWFDDSNAEGRIVAFLGGLLDEDDDEQRREILAGRKEELTQENAAILDLGCGNGELLFALRDDGWEGTMLGVDYSAQSVELARRIGATRDAFDAEEDGEGEEADSEEPTKKKKQQQQQQQQEEEDEKEEEEKKRIPPVNFLEWNLLTGPISPTDPASPLHYAPSSETLFDIVLDKGTFDAISLSATSSPTDDDETHPCETYRQRLLQLLNPHGGIFLVTSCNWTEKELRAWFEDERDGELRAVGRVEYPTFTFGGMKGQTISTLCFRRG